MSTVSSPAPDGARVSVRKCEHWAHGACCAEIFDKEHDGKQYCVLHYPGPEKSKDFKTALERKLSAQDFDFEGTWFPEKLSFQEFKFTGKANFSSARFREVVNFREAEFSAGADFREAKFSTGADFREAKFSADADFREAKFSAGANFAGAQFGSATYFAMAHFDANANFRGTQFRAATSFFGTSFRADAVFNYAQFEAPATFNVARFSKSALFTGAVFNATVYFRKARFKDEDPHRNDDITADNNTIDSKTLRPEGRTIPVDFVEARFKDGLAFTGTKFANRVFMSFASASFEKPERAVFHSTSLRPHWFADIDPRAFSFINVAWGDLLQWGAVRKEIEQLKTTKKSNANQLLEITFRQLAVNAEENNRFEEATNFRYMAMDVKRLQRRRIDPFRLSWWYWLLSGYGERVPRAFLALLSILVLFALAYWVGDAAWWQPKQSRDLASATTSEQKFVSQRLALRESLVYSAGVMALQKPEPLPANKRAKTLVLWETILGPVQAALLALAIRRKFMR